MKKNIKYTLIDTTDRPSYSDYVHFCKANDFEPKGEDSDDYMSYVHETQSMWYNDEMDNIKFSKENDSPVIITGTLGLWNGTKVIYPVRCDTLHEAVEKCIGSSDDAKVMFEDGIIYVEAYHHDGTNKFSVEKLSKRGLKATENWDGPCLSRVDAGKGWTAKFKMI